jgi:hypothetical protein
MPAADTLRGHHAMTEHATYEGITVDAVIIDDITEDGQRYRVIAVDLSAAFEGGWNHPEIVGWDDGEYFAAHGLSVRLRLPGGSDDLDGERETIGDRRMTADQPPRTMRDPSMLAMMCDSFAVPRADPPDLEDIAAGFYAALTPGERLRIRTVWARMDAGK